MSQKGTRKRREVGDQLQFDIVGYPAALTIWILEYTQLAEPVRPDQTLPYQRWTESMINVSNILENILADLVTENALSYSLLCDSNFHVRTVNIFYFHLIFIWDSFFNVIRPTLSI